MSVRAGLLALALLLPLPGIAHAQLRLCNRTSYILYAATAQDGSAGRQVQGWTRLVPGDCQTAIKAALPAQGVQVYARSSLAHSGPQRAWGGALPLCVRDADFNQRQSGAGCAAGSFSVPFAAIDTKGRSSFTMNFDEQPALASLVAAQLAGVKRLLKDNGAPIGAINGSPDKATGKALNAFRGRMKFPPTAGNAELFAALEAQGRKVTAPAGYTVCNDGKDELLVAMGENSQKVRISRGWWRIAAGACARTITTPLKSDAMWLLAQKADGAAVVSGPDRFCVAAQEFEIRGKCAAQGQGEAGFAKTITRGLSGYIVHIPAHHA